MKLKSFAALALSCVLLTGTASAAWSPADFSGGAPSGLVMDGESILVSDVYNKVVWRITEEGVQKAVGQIGIPDLNGEPIGKYDDGTLDTALFMEPWAMTPFLDGFAITDSAANVVRYFDETGVHTAVGSGKAGNRNGIGTQASFDNPTGLATGDNGEVYIADTNNGAIRIMSETGKVTTLVSGLLEPTGLCWHDGALYVAETGRNRILKVTGGSYDVVAGGSQGQNEDGYVSGGYTDGPVAMARFDHPQGVTIGEDGTIYVADTGNQALRKIAVGRVTTLAVSRDTPRAPVQPRGLLVQGNTLLAADLFARTVAAFDLSPVVYTDVPADAWFTPFVADATERGLTGGTGNGAFSPDGVVTRATLAVMLSRLHLQTDGNAVINGDSTFEDVPDGTWFTNAVRWTADLGIVNGTGNGNFSPNDPITREQLAAMLYRYAQYAKYDVSAGESTNLLSYTDAQSISQYAMVPMQWACGAGILSGMGDGTLAPQGQATRAQAVKMMIAAMDAFGI